MSSSSEVVVTGIGVVTPIGVGVDPFWQALLDGVSGVRIQSEFADTDLPFRIGASIEDFDGRKFIKPRKALKVMCRPIQFGCTAAALAATDSGLDEFVIDPDRVATVFGTETFYADPGEVADVFRRCVIQESYEHDRWGEFAMREIQPLWMLKYLPNMVASHISIAMDARGPSNSICQGEASSALSIVEGAELIRRGAADVVVAGGTGSRLMLTSLLHRGTARLSRRIYEPEKACRPFDADRDGMVSGEGAGAIILESKQHAENRGAKVYGRLAGHAQSYCPRSSKRFVQVLNENVIAAIADAGLNKERVDHFNAHADSTVDFDCLEAQAIQKSLGDVPIVSNKGNFGNLGPAASAVETAATLLSLDRGVLTACPNYDTPDPACPVNLVTQTTEAPQEVAVKNSVSSTGQMVTLVFTRATN